MEEVGVEVGGDVEEEEATGNSRTKHSTTTIYKFGEYVCT